MERKLVTIRKITNIKKIPKYDRILSANVDNWYVIINVKDKFQEDDLCVFFEIDSVLPKDDERFEFLSRSNWRIKTMKMAGTISEGLALPLSVLPEGTEVKLGMDVTDIMKVTKYDPYIKNPNLNVPPDPTNKLTDTFKRILGIEADRNFPSFVKKTDLNRVQNVFHRMENKTGFVVTEKLDGSSATYALKLHKLFGIIPYYNVSVWSRNVSQSIHNPRSVWGIVFKKLKMRRKLIELFKLSGAEETCAIQGEIIGRSIQGNKYNLTVPAKFYGYGITIDSIPINPFRYFEELKLETVPVLKTDVDITNSTSEELLKLAGGKSKLNINTLREGVVYKRYEYNEEVSRFKIVDRNFLMEYGE